MAGMDSTVLSKPCFVVLLHLRAKSRVTGCAFGQQRQKPKEKKKTHSDLGKSQPGRKRLRQS